MTALFASVAGRVLGGASLALLIAMAVLGVRLHSVTAERDRLATWQSDVAFATMTAAGQPKLALDQVAHQITSLGAENSSLRSGIAQARADALAAKRDADEANRNRKEEADRALPDQLARARSALARYAAAHPVHAAPDGMRGGQPAAPAVLGDRDRPDLPGATDAPGVGDRSDPAAALVRPDWVSVPRSALDVCTVIRERLVNTRNWALGLGAAAASAR